MTVEEYLATPETTRRRELAWGVVREPPAPGWNHQTIVGRLFTRLDAHVARNGLGKVGLSPLDVILDPVRNLVVQPDLVFVAAPRCGIIRERIWGAPDLVVEVLSPDSRRYDRVEKRAWYERCGVREQWLVDPVSRAISVCDLVHAPADVVPYEGDQLLRSPVLPRLRLRVALIFD
jgi:Uma2 family endonuclease